MCMGEVWDVILPWFWCGMFMSWLGVGCDMCGCTGEVWYVIYVCMCEGWGVHDIYVHV